MSGNVHEIKKEVHLYFKIFGALIVLTVVTVALNHIHAGIVVAVTLALIVAATKASLVASFFMHLAHERKIIYVVMSFTAFFFVCMILLFVFSNYSVPQGTEHLNFKYGTKMITPHGHAEEGSHHETASPEGEGAHETQAPKKDIWD